MTGPRTQAPAGVASAGRTGPPHRRPRLAAYAAQLALGAYGGALGLTTGFLELPSELEQRLPFDSPVLGAVAPAVLVGVPATVLTTLAWRGHRWAPPAAVAVGVLLVGWILVEVAFLREVSFLQPFYAAVGLGLVVWGRSTARAAPHGSGSGSARAAPQR